MNPSGVLYAAKTKNVHEEKRPEGRFSSLDVTADADQHFAVLTHAADQILLHGHVTYLLMRSVGRGRDAAQWTDPS